MKRNIFILLVVVRILIIFSTLIFASGTKDAVESFKQAPRINPDNADAHHNLGIAYLLIRDRNSALNEYKILKDLDIDLANELFDLISK